MTCWLLEFCNVIHWCALHVHPIVLLQSAVLLLVHVVWKMFCLSKDSLGRKTNFDIHGPVLVGARWCLGEPAEPSLGISLVCLVVAGNRSHLLQTYHTDTWPVQFLLLQAYHTDNLFVLCVLLAISVAIWKCDCYLLHRHFLAIY